jgi:hypothetical protein
MSLRLGAVLLLVCLAWPGEVVTGADRERMLRARAYEFVGREGECGPGYPAGHRIVQAERLSGIGLPQPGRPARAGLLLSKNGPTSDCSAALVRILGVEHLTLGELGFDYRNGSHCGGGAPRFAVISSDGFQYFVGCSSGKVSPAPADPAEWTRVRFEADDFVAADPAAPPFELGVTPLRSLYVVHDEGTDATTGADPQGIGLAILDNIDVNGHFVARGVGREDETR